MTEEREQRIVKMILRALRALVAGLEREYQIERRCGKCNSVVNN